MSVRGRIVECHKPDGLFGLGADLENELSYVQKTGTVNYLYEAVKGDQEPKLMHEDICEVLAKVATVNGLTGSDFNQFIKTTYDGAFGNLIAECSEENVLTNGLGE